MALSAQWSFLDINSILTQQIENQRYKFWCKNAGKTAHYISDWHGPISRLCPKLTPNLLWQSESGICNAKGTESKRAGKRKGKGHEKKFGAGSQTKITSPNFGFSHMHQTEILQIVVPDHREIYLVGTK